MATDLGRRILHDPLSRNHQIVAKAQVGLSVTHPLKAPNVDQFYLGGCVGFSGTNLQNVGKAVNSRRMFQLKVHNRPRNNYLVNDDGIENYHQATVYDDFEGVYPPTDEGSSALGLMKWWKSSGIIKEYKWIIDGGIESVAAAVQQTPVLFGSWWYANMTDPDSKHFVHATGEQQGGHEYLCNSIHWNTLASKRYFGFENSWGDLPRFYMTWEEAEALLADDGDVAVPILL
jgi:hypothetical protein